MMIQTTPVAVGNMFRSLNPALLYPEKRASLQLEQFRCFDFSSMPGELAAVFQNHAKIKLRYLPLAYRVAVDGAGPYDEEPVREFEGVSTQVANRFAEVYAELGVDDLLLEMEQAGVLQQSYIIGCWPDAKGRLRLHPFLPYEVVSIRFDDPFARDDIADASEVVLSRVIQRPNMFGIVSPWVTQIVLTPTEAWQVLPDGNRIGIFAPDGSNPIGKVPLVATRRVRPVYNAENRALSTDGGFLPGVAQDVQSCQIGLILAFSHLEWVVRSQTHTKVAVFGEDAADLPDQIRDTPDGAMLFPADVKVTPITLNPPVEKYIRVVETTAYYLSQYRYLRPEAYQASIVTGQARKQDALGFVAQTKRQTRRCRTLEGAGQGPRGLKALIANVYNATQRTALKLPPDATLRVRHRHVRSDENILQEQQARSVKLQNLMTSHVEEIANEEGIPAAQARKLALARLEDLATFLREQTGATPGLDKLKGSSAGPTAPPSADVAKEAFTGIQTEAMKAIVTDVANGILPAETARPMLVSAYPSLDPSLIDAMLGGLEGFTPTPEPEPDVPFRGAPDDEDDE